MTHILSALTVGIILLSAPVSATADEDSGLDPVIAYALTAAPGGIALDARHAVWPDGMELRAPEPFAKAVLTCPTMRICAFQGTATSGAMLSWNSCGTYSTSALSGVGSIANARAAGSVLRARNGTPILTTATAGSGKNVYGTTTNVQCLE